MKEDQIKATAIIQERDYGSLHPGDSNCDDSNSEEKWSDPGYSVEVRPTGFDWLKIGCKRKRKDKGDSLFFWPQPLGG